MTDCCDWARTGVMPPIRRARNNLALVDIFHIGNKFGVINIVGVDGLKLWK